MMPAVTRLLIEARVTFEALVELFRCDLTMARFDFPGLQRWVERCPRAGQRRADNREIARTFASVARATVYYPRTMLCLPRAAVATRLLRRRGVAAVLVVGVRHAPFAAHAWVEIEGTPAGPEGTESHRYTRLMQLG